MDNPAQLSELIGTIHEATLDPGMKAVRSPTGSF